MAGKILKAVVTVTLVLLIAGLIFWWTRTDNLEIRESIRRDVQDAEQAFAARDLQGLMAPVSADYSDAEGNTRRDLIGYAQRALAMTRWMRVSATLEQMAFGGEHVMVQMIVRRGPPHPQDLTTMAEYEAAIAEYEQNPPAEYSVRTTWQKEDGSWKIIDSEGWQHLVPANWKTQSNQKNR